MHISYLKKIFLLPATVALCLAGNSLDAAPKMDINKVGRSHPRLFITPHTKHVIGKNAQTFYGKPLSERIIHDADNFLTMPPVERKMIYGQMLFSSRKISTVIQHLAMAYMLTGKKEYADRAIREMEHAAGFADWNPVHYLDTAEMIFALSIGYDWLYSVLTPEQRKTITAAIIEKGLKPSFKGDYWWMKKSSNWNPVCHSGMVAGAIVIADIDPELSEKVIQRAIDCVPQYIRRSYYPGGSYPEGPSYWSYGTVYLCYLLGMLNNSFGTDFGFSDIPGLANTGAYAQAMTSPIGYWFNHADCSWKRGVSFEMTYLAHHFKRPDFFDPVERGLILEYAKKRPKMPLRDVCQHIPLVMVYLNHSESVDFKGALSYFSGNGAENPVVIMRSGYDKDAAWLATKGGTGNTLHGHMDAGSFCFTSKGYRWTYDLGGDRYGVLEEKGISVWDYSQHSSRWKVFRYGVQSHNTLQINGHRQNVYAKATYLKHSDTEVVIDLSGTYKQDAGKTIRTLQLLPDGGMKCTDSLVGLKPGAKVKWQICTFCRYGEEEDGSMLLIVGRWRMRMRKTVDVPWEIKTDEELRRKDLDFPNPGLKMISFTAIAPEDGKLEFSVTMTPEYFTPEKKP